MMYEWDGHNSQANTHVHTYTSNNTRNTKVHRDSSKGRGSQGTPITVGIFEKKKGFMSRMESKETVTRGIQ